jgi:hypothetical protein
MISIINRTVGVGIGIVTALALFMITKFPIWWTLLLILFLWGVIIFVTERVLKKIVVLRYYIPTISIITMLAFVGLLLFVEWEVLRNFLVVLGGVILGLLYGWSVPNSGYTTHIEKSYRRMIMMLWVFDVYALMTTLFAFDLFFQNMPIWMLSILSGGLFAYVSFMIWQMYYAIDFRRAVLWMGCVALIGVELVWVFKLLPFGYTALGLLVTWIWYIVQLFFRFHFSKAGIVWKKQRLFLVGNLVLMTMLIYFVQWI